MVLDAISWHSTVLCGIAQIYFSRTVHLCIQHEKDAAAQVILDQDPDGAEDHAGGGSVVRLTHPVAILPGGRPDGAILHSGVGCLQSWACSSRCSASFAARSRRTWPPCRAAERHLLPGLRDDYGGEEVPAEGVRVACTLPTRW